MGTLPFRWWFLLQSHLCSCQEFMNRNYRSLVKYCLPLPNSLLLCLRSTLECILPFSFLARVLSDCLNTSLGLGLQLTGRKSMQNSSMGLGEKSWPADGYIITGSLCSKDCNLPVCKSRSRAEITMPPSHPDLGSFSLKVSGARHNCGTRTCVRHNR